MASTGAIGGLLLRRLEKVKSGWRVEFVCGLRAVRAARREYVLLTGMAASLSVGAGEVPKRLAALQDENKAAAKLQRGLLDELAVTHANLLLAGSPEGSLVAARFAGKPIEFAKRVASTVAGTGRPAVIGATEGEAGALAFAVSAGDRRHAGNLLRETFAASGARGGGSAELAQGVCRPEQLDALMAALAARLV